MTNFDTSGRTASDTAAPAHTAPVHVEHHDRPETKSAFKTTEFWIYVVVSIAILVASAVVGNGEGDGKDLFNAPQAWSYVALVTVGYLISRGLAKIGVRGRGRNRDDS